MAHIQSLTNTAFFLACMQLAQWIRGSCTEAIQHLLQARPEAETYGVGRQFAHREEGWRKLIRGAWITGLLERRMIHGAGVGLSKTTAMNTVHPVLCSENFPVTHSRCFFQCFRKIPRSHPHRLLPTPPKL